MANALSCLIPVCLLLSSMSASVASAGDRIRNPDGWFTLEIPSRFVEVHRHADVDGGFFSGEDVGLNMDVSWSYWSYAGAPNFIRETDGRVPRDAAHACPDDSKRSKTVINGREAVVEQCPITATDRDYQQGLRFRYVVALASIEIADNVDPDKGTAALARAPGVFTLQVTYRRKEDISVARHIASSLKFLP